MERVEGMEKKDGQEMGLPDLPKGTPREDRVGEQKQTGGLSITLQSP